MRRLLLLAVTAVMFAAVQVRPAAATPDVSAALLTLEDMPGGWKQGTPPSLDGTVPSASVRFCGKDLESLRSLPVQETDVERAEAWFERGPLGPFLYHIALALPPGTGELGMALLRDLARPCEWEEVAENGTVSTWRLTPLDVPPLGDDTLALRLDVRASLIAVQGDLIIIRRGDFLTVLLHAAGGVVRATVDSGLTERFAGRADERLAALARGQ